MGEVHFISPDVLADARSEANAELWDKWSQPEEPTPTEKRLSLIDSNESPESTPRIDKPKLRLIESDTDVRNELIRSFLRLTVSKLPLPSKSKK